MDGFQRTGSSSGQFGSQVPQMAQPKPQVSQPGAPFAQAPTPQGSAQTSRSAFSLPQSPQPAQGQPFSPSQGPADARQSFGRASQNTAASKLQPNEQRVPSISRRTYIKWSMVSGGDGNQEDTETLVLTDPKSSFFVDVRLLKRTLRNIAPGSHAQLEPEQIDWAFAGTTVSTPLGHDKAPYHRHVRFNHWIDSRSLHPEEIVDNAYMSYPEDGSTDEIEVGSMVNPHTGDKQGYEERWAEEDVYPAAGQNSRLCIAMTTEQPDGTRGCVMVLGQWAQGVLRTGQGTLHIERWWSKQSDLTSTTPRFGPTSRTPGPPSATPAPQGQSIYPSPQLSTVGIVDDSEGGWALVARVGVPILPSPTSFVDKNLTEGSTCSVDGMLWQVQAVRRW